MSVGFMNFLCCIVSICLQVHKIKSTFVDGILSCMMTKVWLQPVSPVNWPFFQNAVQNLKLNKHECNTQSFFFFFFVSNIGTPLSFCFYFTYLLSMAESRLLFKDTSSVNGIIIVVLSHVLMAHLLRLKHTVNIQYVCFAAECPSAWAFFLLCMWQQQQLGLGLLKSANESVCLLEFDFWWCVCFQTVQATVQAKTG